MHQVRIGSKNIGIGLPSLISLEPGGTFENFDIAKNMISVTAEAGADAIKFQTFLPGDAERMMGDKNITIDFTTPKGKSKELVLDALKRRELLPEQWIELVNHSKKLGLSFITAAYFPETIDFISKIGIDAIKVSKGDINNVLLIEKIAKTNLPVILDAREKLADIDIAVEICEKHGNQQIIIMHCPSGYPAKNSGVHLNAIKTIQQKYDYPVGFADHSLGGLMNYAAIALGVNMIEKTITINKQKEQVEHFMSLELEELSNFIKNIKAVEEALGDSQILNKSRVEDTARRSLTAKQKICKGEIITFSKLDFKRPGNIGISVSKGFEVLNKKATKDISEGEFIQWDMLD